MYNAQETDCGPFEIQVIVGQADVQQSSIQAFPNPINGLVQIKGVNENSDLSITGIDGKILMKDKIKADDILDISALPTGTYILSISNEQEVFHQTVVKM